MLRCENLSTGYKNSVILKGINLHIDKGTILSIIGPNGCGKSTLIRTLTGLLKQLDGKIWINDRTIESYDLKTFAQTVAILPQTRTIPTITVESLVGHGRFPYLGYPRQLTEIDKEKIAYAMELTEVIKWRNTLLPNLSAGERQRVYIAMVIAQDTPLVFLDEPSTYMDICHRFELLSLVQKMKSEGKTIVMVLHDIADALTNSDILCVVQDGTISIAGTTEEVFSSGVIDRTFGIESQKVYHYSGKSSFCFFNCK